MRIEISVTVIEDGGPRTTLDINEDQWRIGSDEDRPIKRVRNDALRRTREAVDRLIERAERRP